MAQQHKASSVQVSAQTNAKFHPLGQHPPNSGGTREMTRPHPLTTLTERAWAKAWDGEQQFVDRLHARRGSWLPNIIESRGWGVMRWTSGRPDHAATSGQAVAETFVVLRPDIDDPAVRAEVSRALRDEPPVARLSGYDIRQYQLAGVLPGALGLAIVGLAVAALAGAGIPIMLLALLVGAAIGAAGGAAVAHVVEDRRNAGILRDEESVRMVMGRYAPTSWNRLVESVTDMEATLPRSSEAGEPDLMAADAVRLTLWEAAGLLINSSDHSGIDVLADGVTRLVEAHRS